MRAKRIVVLGGGTGGTLVANRLRRRYDEQEVEIHVVDRDDRHLYQPGLLFVPFGMEKPERLVRSRRAQLRKGVAFHEAEIDAVSLDDDEVRLADGSVLAYDVLVVASGVALQPQETEGLLGPGWRESMFSFYGYEDAVRLRQALAAFEGGTLVVDIVDMPIKCPVAPIEFVFLADWFLRGRGIRAKTELILATPLDGCFTKPVARKHLEYLLEQKQIRLEVEFNAGEARGDARRLVAYDGRELPFDLLVAVPLHGGQPYVGRSDGLGDALGFVPTDQATLQAQAKPNVFTLGDAADLPTSKSGSGAHFQGEVLVENVARFLRGEAPAAGYDGHVNCFVETGFGKALMIDFNYDVEPVPGRFPTAIGPLPLLRESRANHLAKRAFEWVYWNALLPGRDLPGLGPTMPVAGKELSAAA